jgi:hypothetical protein
MVDTQPNGGTRVTIIERIRGERRPVQFGRIAKDLMNRDMNALGRDTSGVRDQVKDIRIAAADAIEHFQALASEAADRAGEALEHVGDEAARATAKATKDVSKATKDVSVDAGKGADDLADRIRKALPTDRIGKIVETLERDLPTTDKGRYDRAYSRGWARARTGFVIVGAAVGIAAGIAGALLLDPNEGPRRRAALRLKVRSTTEGVTGQLSRTATMATERARGLATERGLIKPNGEAARQITSPAPARVPVMDIPSNGYGDTQPVMPLATGPVTNPASIEREPFATPDGGLIGGMTGAEEATIGDEAERETWPRTT